MWYLIFLVLIFIGFSVGENKVNTPNPLLLQTYGPNDLATKPAFQGGYINFGYWKGIYPKKDPITKEDRIKASEALYDLVISRLNIQPTDKIVEIGSGRGNGCAKIAKSFKHASIVGIDVTLEQVMRANTIHKDTIAQVPSLSFLVSDSIPLPDSSATKIFSVEAAQCFPSMERFARDAWRVLEPGGRLVITAHFATNKEGFEALGKVLPTVNQGLDILIPIQDVRDAFAKEGFKEVGFESIGEYVFEGFKKWRSTIEDADWAKYFFVTYEQKHLDYYLLVFDK